MAWPNTPLDLKLGKKMIRWRGDLQQRLLQDSTMGGIVRPGTILFYLVAVGIAIGPSLFSLASSTLQPMDSSPVGCLLPEVGKVVGTPSAAGWNLTESQMTPSNCVRCMGGPTVDLSFLSPSTAGRGSKDQLLQDTIGAESSLAYVLGFLTLDQSAAYLETQAFLCFGTIIPSSRTFTGSGLRQLVLFLFALLVCLSYLIQITAYMSTSVASGIWSDHVASSIPSGSLPGSGVLSLKAISCVQAMCDQIDPERCAAQGWAQPGFDASLGNFPTGTPLEQFPGVVVFWLGGSSRDPLAVNRNWVVRLSMFATLSLTMLPAAMAILNNLLATYRGVDPVSLLSLVGWRSGVEGPWYAVDEAVGLRVALERVYRRRTNDYLRHAHCVFPPVRSRLYNGVCFGPGCRCGKRWRDFKAQRQADFEREQLDRNHPVGSLTTRWIAEQGLGRDPPAGWCKRCCRRRRLHFCECFLCFPRRLPGDAVIGRTGVDEPEARFGDRALWRQECVGLGAVCLRSRACQGCIRVPVMSARYLILRHGGTPADVVAAGWPHDVPVTGRSGRQLRRAGSAATAAGAEGPPMEQDWNDATPAPPPTSGFDVYEIEAYDWLYSPAMVHAAANRGSACVVAAATGLMLRSGQLSRLEQGAELEEIVEEGLEAAAPAKPLGREPSGPLVRYRRRSTLTQHELRDRVRAVHNPLEIAGAGSRTPA